MRAKTWTLSFAFLLLAPFALRAAGEHVCGEHDLMFACTQTAEKGKLRAGCGVHEKGRFFSSEWRVYDLHSEEVLGRVPARPDGIALIKIPQQRWFILEGETVCSTSSSKLAIPYRFLVERTGKDSFRQRPYTPENLVATGNWNADTQLNYGAFRSRSLVGSGPASQLE
ncbi:MAG TPA: hypothetical protein VG477_10565 [Thermoanaerobaculia bacterium]|nr:hypothetical protein [Thermoanaerobaculia bacterium]